MTAVIDQDAIAAYNMTYLSLDQDQYHRFQDLMRQKMTAWPDDLWQYTQEVVREYALCGEVLGGAVADYVRGSDRMTKMRPPTMPVPPALRAEDV